MKGLPMDKTLDMLPKEGDIKSFRYVRQTCENCGEIAHYKHTFLLPNARSNPASKAYRKDDCSWCEDTHQFSCRDEGCQQAMQMMEGYSRCSTFPASERFAHMFLYWQKEDS